MKIYVFIVIILASIAIYYVGDKNPIITYLIGVFVGSTIERWRMDK